MKISKPDRMIVVLLCYGENIDNESIVLLVLDDEL